jgi:hypothetical protein
MHEPIPAFPAGPGRIDGEVVEVPLLLPGWQAAALEAAAHDRGLTAAEMVRRLVRDFVRELEHDAPFGGRVEAV